MLLTTLKLSSLKESGFLFFKFGGDFLLCFVVMLPLSSKARGNNMLLFGDIESLKGVGKAGTPILRVVYVNGLTLVGFSLISSVVIDFLL